MSFPNISPAFLSFIVSLTLVGLLGIYFYQKINEQNHTIKTMFELIQPLISEVEWLRVQVYSNARGGNVKPETQNIHFTLEKEDNDKLIEINSQDLEELDDEEEEEDDEEEEDEEDDAEEEEEEEEKEDEKDEDDAEEDDEEEDVKDYDGDEKIPVLEEDENKGNIKEPEEENFSSSSFKTIHFLDEKEHDENETFSKSKHSKKTIKELRLLAIEKGADKDVVSKWKKGEVLQWLEEK